MKEEVNRITVVQPTWELQTPMEWGPTLLKIVERAGRTCYKSTHRVGKDSAGSFIRARIKDGHTSLLDHISISVMVVGSRAMSHQLVRHRIGVGISQESMRYCDPEKTHLCDLDDFYLVTDLDTAENIDRSVGLLVVLPPSFESVRSGTYDYTDRVGWTRTVGNKYLTSAPIHDRDLDDILYDYRAYRHARDVRNIPAEDARFKLPHATKTELMFTADVTEWRWIFRKRVDMHAQWEIRGIMTSILSHFKDWLSDLFFDIQFPTVKSIGSNGKTTLKPGNPVAILDINGAYREWKVTNVNVTGLHDSVYVRDFGPPWQHYKLKCSDGEHMFVLGAEPVSI